MRDHLEQMVASYRDFVARLDIILFNELGRQVQIEAVPNFQHPTVLRYRLTSRSSFSHRFDPFFNINDV